MSDSDREKEPMQRPEPGTSRTIAKGVRVVLAPNGGPMTHWGTNTFILGEGRVAIIDPGPDDEAHLAALLAATKGEVITHILVTHAHLDHSPLAARLGALAGAPVLGFGRADAGRSDVMAALAAAGLSGGGEGVDVAFEPDRCLVDGELVAGDGWAVEVLHTPGHFAGHLSFRYNDMLFSGDHVMDWASTLVSPPDGDVSDFMATSQRMIDLAPDRLLPAHGAPIHAVSERLEWLMTHRKSRETAILEGLTGTPQSLGALAAQIYRDIDQRMLPAAERNVLAHLIDLKERKMILAEPELGLNAGFLRLE